MKQSADDADDNLKFDENSRKFSNWIENTVGKGEIARYEQFLLFPQCFQKACFPGASKGVIVWEWVEILYHANRMRTEARFILFCSLLMVQEMYKFISLITYLMMY